MFAVGLQGRIHLLPQCLHLSRVREPLGVCEEEGVVGENPSPRKPPGDLGTWAGSLKPPAQEAGSSENGPLHAAAKAPQPPGQSAHPSLTPPGQSGLQTLGAGTSWGLPLLAQSSATLCTAAPRRPGQGPRQAPRTRVAHGAPLCAEATSWDPHKGHEKAEARPFPVINSRPWLSVGRPGG